MHALPSHSSLVSALVSTHSSIADLKGTFKSRSTEPRPLPSSNQSPCTQSFERRVRRSYTVWQNFLYNTVIEAGWNALPTSPPPPPNSLTTITSRLLQYLKNDNDNNDKSYIFVCATFNNLADTVKPSQQIVPPNLDDGNTQQQ